MMMQTELLKKVERVLEEKVRPELGGHEGNIEVVSLEDGRSAFWVNARDAPPLLLRLSRWSHRKYKMKYLK